MTTRMAHGAMLLLAVAAASFYPHAAGGTTAAPATSTPITNTTNDGSAGAVGSAVVIIIVFCIGASIALLATCFLVHKRRGLRVRAENMHANTVKDIENSKPCLVLLAALLAAYAAVVAAARGCAGAVRSARRRSARYATQSTPQPVDSHSSTFPVDASSDRPAKKPSHRYSTIARLSDDVDSKVQEFDAKLQELKDQGLVGPDMDSSLMRRLPAARRSATEATAKEQQPFTTDNRTVPRRTHTVLLAPGRIKQNPYVTIMPMGDADETASLAVGAGVPAAFTVCQPSNEDTGPLGMNALS